MSAAEAMLAWSSLALAVTLAPGPDTLLVAGHAGRSGARAGLAAVGGVIAGGVWYMALCGFGYLSVVAASPTLHVVVKSVGAAYLAFLGLRMIAGAVLKAPLAPAGPPTLGAPFRQGLLTNILNPKVALFYLAALPQFVGAGPDAAAAGALLVAIHYAMGAVWLSIVALGAARAGRSLRESSIARWLDGAIGAFFVGLAGRLVAERS
jgi:threonine/homoserine/homoserine lactone efflux protein